MQGTTIDVAKAKCRSAARQLNGPVITEDTALCFSALGGLPGPYIKDFLGQLGVDRLHLLLAGFEDKKATAVCTFAYCESAEAEPIVFEGKTEGRLVEPRGQNRFGWDPCMEVEGTGKTYAEMDSDEKNKVRTGKNPCLLAAMASNGVGPFFTTATALSPLQSPGPASRLSHQASMSRWHHGSHFPHRANRQTPSPIAYQM